MKKKILIIVFLLIGFISTCLNAQTTKIDSLEILLKTHTSKDTIRVNLLNETASKLFRVNNNKALKYAKEAGELADKINFTLGKAENLRLIGIYYYYKSDYSQAVEYYQKSLKIFKELGNNQGISKCLNNIGIIHKNQGNYPRALEYYQESLKIKEELGNKIGISICLNNIGLIYSNQGDYPQALEYFQKSLKIKKELAYKEGVATVLYNIGIIHFNQANYTKALECYYKSLKIREEFGDKNGISMCLNNIGLIHKNQGYYTQALEYYQKSLKMSEELGGKKDISLCLNNIGNIHKRQGYYTQALECFQKSLEMNKELGDKKGISLCLDNIGIIHRMQGDYTQALEYYQKSLKINEELKDKKCICESYYNFGAVYLKTNSYTKALDYTGKSLKIAKELELLNNQKDIYEQLSEIYAGLKNYKKAYKSYMLFKELNDSIFNEENIKKITGIEYQYKYEKEKQATELIQQKKDAVNAEEIKYQKTIKNVLIVGLLVAVLIILLFFRIVHIKKKKNKEILWQKYQISEQKSEIQVQAEELTEHKEHLEKIVKQRTADLIKAKEQAEESNQLKTAFLNNISHEFRTPMNGILGFSYLLNKSNLSQEEQEEYIENVNKSCNQLLNIVNDTVEISKVHSRQIENIKSQVNISNVITDIINEFKKSALEKNIEIKLELNLGTEHSLIQIDKNKIKRIFWHIINNAVKFTYSGYIKIIGQAEDNNQIQFQIEDTGIGIPAELHEKIFEPFRQAETSSSRRFGGNGIGLSLSKAYIEIIGGKIWLKSQPDKGTTIFFTVPTEKSIKKETKKEIITTGDINNKTILIAEDNELNYLLIQKILFNYNIKLLHAWNGKETLKIFNQEKHIDLILLDLKMPIMDGYEAIKQIKQINPKIPVIAQTAYASDTNKVEIGLAGFDDYITKPIKANKLIQIVKQRL